MSGAIYALSVRQPWASLIVAGLKPVENRSRQTSHRGRVLIHASGAKMRPDDLSDAYATLGHEMGTAWLRAANLSTGRMVGSVSITDMCGPDDHCGCSVDWIDAGSWHWVLADARAYAGNDLECLGKLGLWRVPDSLASRCGARGLI